MRGYRAHLDGLRGVAIALVLVQHFAGWPRSAGTVGVAVFFALSGYLITALLLDEHDRAGRVDLLGFYARRAGRLMPGLLCMIAVTVPLLRLTRQSVTGPALGALSYSTNVGMVTGWLNANADPYVQTWSLAVEEHFYLLWAPALILAARRGGARVTLRWALTGAALSTACRLGVAGITGHAVWVSWGTACRGDALLVGCAAAAATRLGYVPSRGVLPVSAATVAALVFLTPRTLGGPAVPLALALTVTSLACAGLVVALDMRDGWPARALSIRPLVALGELSYSLYLWHLPMLYLIGDRLPRVATLGLAFVAAYASHRLVERPARRAVRAVVAARRSETRDRHERTGVAAHVQRNAAALVDVDL